MTIDIGNWDPPPVVKNFALADGVPGAAGRAIQIRASVAGTVSLLMAGGTTNVVDVPTGTSIFPYSVTMATAGTATIVTYENLF